MALTDDQKDALRFLHNVAEGVRRYYDPKGGFPTKKSPHGEVFGFRQAWAADKALGINRGD
jgi:hypothetical protein